LSSHTIAYIDGLNLFYGCLKGTPYKWLNLEKLLGLTRPKDTVEAIYYFTALVTSSREKRLRQQQYLKVLRTLPKVKPVFGYFRMRRTTRKMQGRAYYGELTFLKEEEKKTDVNIAVQMLDDAYQDKAERFVLVSADQDFVPIIDRIRTRFPKKRVFVYVPASGSLDPRAKAPGFVKAAHRTKLLSMANIIGSQFPDQVLDLAGNVVAERPPEWR
jgi:uncharacterized LabA/DUF88 family protein